jgi:hypothetical protein
MIPVGERVKRSDALQAAALSAGSAVMNALPPQWNIIGRSDAPSYIPVRWRFSFPGPLYRAGKWLTFEGAAHAGDVPSRYPMAATILVDREKMDALLTRGGTRSAAAYQLGTAVMYGTSQHEILGLENPDAGDYQFAMRIGKGPLIAQAGAEVETRGSFWAPYRAAMYQPLETGVRRGPVVPVSELPPNVPLL